MTSQSNVPVHEKLNLISLIGCALADFEHSLLSTGWRGKENDCVNLFTHGFLFSRIHTDAAITDFTQVGIEVGVPKPPSIGSKEACRKDLVIWRQPRQVAYDEKTWKPSKHPMAIVEWKTHRKPITPILDARDIQWLSAYSQHLPDFVGFAVTVDFTSNNRRVASALIQRDNYLEDFHRKGLQ